ncbi:hypothetical protein OMP38_28295 [Cohnella ginsengisoli]|uniref:Uncharacterized protein n=1 Tax=Cohnella ginsengisoli TaxID=425004 RepID=A0A9X4QQ73_9BACL|nr:hypothetical protein [Cohnella ginsengisoli]MDG0794302.1 hypothetical protein [Cohnella ginsengisoli]
MSTQTNYDSGLEKFNRIGRGTNVVFHLIFILLALLCLIPVVVVLSISLSDESSIRESGYHILPKVLSGDAYNYIVKQGSMITRALGVSVLVTAGGHADRRAAHHVDGLRAVASELQAERAAHVDRVYPHDI